MVSRRFARDTSIVSVLLVVLGSSVAAEDWLGWRGADRANHSPETGLFDSWGNDGPPLAWLAEGTGSGYANVSVAGNRAYTTGNFETSQSVVAIDTNSGEIVWKQAISEAVPKHGYPGSRSTPTIDSDRLYVVSSDGRIVCLRGKDGSQLWSRDFKDWEGKMMSGWGYAESPLVDGDLVICTPGGRQGMVVALNKLTGEQAWACRLPDYADETGLNGKPLKDGAGYASIVISHAAGVKQYIQLVGRGLIGVRAADGKLMWRYDQVANGTANIPTAIVNGDYVFTSTGYNTGAAKLLLVREGDGVKAEEVYWLDARQLQNKHGGMTLIDGHIFAGSGGGKPVCLNFNSGELAWGPLRAEGSGETSLIAADGHIVWRREDGTLILTTDDTARMDVIDTFMPVFKDGKSWAHPVIANGKLYLREQNKLMCYQLK